MNQLEPCPHCKRHVRVTETACPFCAATIDQAMAQVRARILPSTRLGRAALFAFGVGASVAASSLEGCGGDDDESAMMATIYGGPPRPVDAGKDAGADAGLDAGPGSQGAVYGGPPRPDTSRGPSIETADWKSADGGLLTDAAPARSADAGPHDRRDD